MFLSSAPTTAEVRVLYRCLLERLVRLGIRAEATCVDGGIYPFLVDHNLQPTTAAQVGGRAAPSARWLRRLQGGCRAAAASGGRNRLALPRPAC